MTLADLAPLANHLWQSTLFAAAAWLLSLTLRKNRAAVRYWIWLAASAKFLIPFSFLIGAGSHLGWQAAPAITQPQLSYVMEGIGTPFAAPSQAAHAAPGPQGPNVISSVVIGVWFCGFIAVLCSQLRSWRLIRSAIRTAAPLHLNLSIRVLSSRARLEPGVFGVCKPVLLFPEGIADRLTPSQLNAIVAHELCHVRRRDNLTATIHMAVEAVFWFHPLVWWIEARLIEERERACDEEVLRVTGEPEVYAQGILNVCKFYLESPLVCVSGITGANLKKRIDGIMAHRAAHELDWVRRLLLIAAGTAALAGPVAIGLVNAPTIRAQSPSTPLLAFDAASVKANNSGDERAPSMILPGGRFTATNNTLRSLILNAYGIWVSPNLLSGGPAWIESERYDIEAKAAPNAIPAGAPSKVLWEKTRLMLRTLLAERFKLTIRRETKEMPVYELVVGKNGPKLGKAAPDCETRPIGCHGFSGGPRQLSGFSVDTSDIALILSSFSDRPVLDKTGIQGVFDIKLQWNPFAARTQPTEDVQSSPRAEGREGPAPDLSSLPTLFTALEQQLGLRLESRKGPVETFVIDHVERPSEN